MKKHSWKKEFNKEIIYIDESLVVPKKWIPKTIPKTIPKNSKIYICKNCGLMKYIDHGHVPFGYFLILTFYFINNCLLSVNKIPYTCMKNDFFISEDEFKI